MSSKQIVVALAMLSLMATASVAQAGSHRPHAAAQSAGAGYQVDDPPWRFDCIKDHGAQRCSDLNQ